MNIVNHTKGNRQVTEIVHTILLKFSQIVTVPGVHKALNVPPWIQWTSSVAAPMLEKVESRTVGSYIMVSELPRFL